MRNELKNYIKSRGTIGEAACAIGISMQFLHRILNGEPCGYWVAKLIEEYSKNQFKAEDLVRQYKRKAFDQRLST